MLNSISSRLLIRPAMLTDIETFYPEGDMPTVKAWVGEIEGRIVGVGGLAFSQGRWVAFLDLTDAARPYKVSIVKAARRAMREAERAGHRVILAAADAREPTARRFLITLGFEPDMKTGIFRWRV